MAVSGRTGQVCAKPFTTSHHGVLQPNRFCSLASPTDQIRLLVRNPAVHAEMEARAFLQAREDIKQLADSGLPTDYLDSPQYKAALATLYNGKPLDDRALYLGLTLFYDGVGVGVGHLFQLSFKPTPFPRRNWHNEQYRRDQRDDHVFELSANSGLFSLRNQPFNAHCSDGRVAFGKYRLACIFRKWF